MNFGQRTTGHREHLSISGNHMVRAQVGHSLFDLDNVDNEGSPSHGPLPVDMLLRVEGRPQNCTCFIHPYIIASATMRRQVLRLRDKVYLQEL
jgi:hypothetical protein